jgi:hypothetical protein
MAQAFDISAENRIAAEEFSIDVRVRTRFQITAPGRPDQLDSWNMGPPSARRKRAYIGQTRPAAGPIPGLAIRPEVNQSCRI